MSEIDKQIENIEREFGKAAFLPVNNRIGEQEAERNEIKQRIDRAVEVIAPYFLPIIAPTKPSPPVLVINLSAWKIGRKDLPEFEGKLNAAVELMRARTQRSSIVLRVRHSPVEHNMADVLVLPEIEI